MVVIPLKSWIMPATIITTDDLREFKLELLDDIKKLLLNQSQRELKRYLKSSEVMDLLHVSAGTLQNLRDSGTLSFIKKGRTIFYDSEELQNVMKLHKS